MVAFQELKEYRRAGIRTFADAELYEADKKRKSTVQPSLPQAAPGSLPRNWQYPGSAAAEVSLGFVSVWMTVYHILRPNKQQSQGYQKLAVPWICCCRGQTLFHTCLDDDISHPWFKQTAVTRLSETGITLDPPLLPCEVCLIWSHAINHFLFVSGC